MAEKITGTLKERPATFEMADESTLKVVTSEEVVVTEKTVNYNYDFLLSQKEMITKQRDELIALKEAELSEVNELIAQCEALGIVKKSISADRIRPSFNEEIV